MTEVSQSSEMQEMLPKAVKEIGGNYVGDRLASLLGTQSREQRDEIWQRTAKEFPPFTENIVALRKALENAEVTKNAYPSQIEAVMSLHFSDIEDEVAKLLLTDILFARTTTRPGYMDYDMDVAEESKVMIKELGIEDGQQGEQAKKVTLDRVVEGVLVGSLKLTRQTQLKEK